jgi:hypothetical protein
VLYGEKRTRLSRPTTTAALIMLGLMSLMGSPVGAFTAYNCMNKSNVVESYSLLEADMGAGSNRNREIKTTVYGDIVQIKQDRIIPDFRFPGDRDYCISELWALVISSFD